MPFTPLHFGPGYLIEVADRRGRFFSFFVFVLVQVIIDVETLRNMFADAPRLHTFFHSFLGSLGAATIALAVYRPLFRVTSWLLGPLGGFLQRARFLSAEVPGWRCAAISAWVGAWSHVILDAMVHRDPEPFWPLAAGNPFAGLSSSESVYGACLYLGLIGIALQFWYSSRGSRASRRSRGGKG